MRCNFLGLHFVGLCTSSTGPLATLPGFSLLWLLLRPGYLVHLSLHWHLLTIMPWRSRRSSTPILQSHPKQAARAAFLPHGRELAPFRIDGVSGPSPVRPSWIPRCDNPVPAPVWGPTSTRISRDASPLPKPAFQSAQMYSRYPSEFRAFPHVLQDVQQPAVLPTAPQARPGPYTAAPPAVRPSSSALVRQADLRALNGPK